MKSLWFLTHLAIHTLSLFNLCIWNYATIKIHLMASFSDCTHVELKVRNLSLAMIS